MCHVPLPCSVGISELIKVCVLVINVLWVEMWGKETQAQEGLCWTAERVWGEDYSLPGLVSLFHPDDEDPLKGQTPHLWWWLRINQKHRQGGNASKSRVNNELLIGSIGCTNKDLSHSNRREMVILRPRCHEVLLHESCISLQMTHTHWLLLFGAPGRKSLKLISSLCKTIMAKQIHSILIGSVLFTAWPHSLMISLNLLCSCMPVCWCVCVVNV